MGFQVCGRWPFLNRVATDRPPALQPFNLLLKGTCPGMKRYAAPRLSPRRRRLAAGLAR